MNYILLDILKPFHYPTQEYFYFGMISFAAYIYLVGVYYSNRRKEREISVQEDQIKIEGEKIRIANEMHDDLGADLSNLLFKLKMYQNSNGNKNVDDYQEIESFTKEIIKKVNETIWTLNSEKDTLISLSNFMLKFLEEFLRNSNITYQFQKADELPAKVILIEKRRNIFHLFKETIKFIVSLEGVTNIDVQLNLELNNLLISISYQCVENEITKTEQQNLLDLMQKRIEVLDAEFTHKKRESKKNEILYKIEI